MEILVRGAYIAKIELAYTECSNKPKSKSEYQEEN